MHHSADPTFSQLFEDGGAVSGGELKRIEVVGTLASRRRAKNAIPFEKFVASAAISFRRRTKRSSFRSWLNLARRAVRSNGS